MSERWFELEDSMLTNQPLIWRRGRQIPDPDVEPTEAYLFLYEARKLKKGIFRRVLVKTIKAKNAADLDIQLHAFVNRKDVVFVGDKERSQYLNFHGLPERKSLP